MFQVVVHRRAARYLRRLPPKAQTRIKGILSQLRERPTKLSGVKAMAGEWKGYWRVRVGEYRVIYWLDPAADRVYVDHIGPRGDIYK